MNTSAHISAGAALARYEAATSARGLFHRYVEERRAYLLHRLGLICFGGLVLGWIANPLTGLVSSLAVLIAECIEAVALDRAQQALSRSAAFDGVKRLADRAAALHAVCVAGTIAVAWHGFSGQEGAKFMITVMVAAAMLNAGSVMRYNPQATKVRLGILGGTWAGLYIGALATTGPDTALALSASAAACLAYLLAVYLRYVSRQQRQHNSQQRALLDSQLQLERINTELLDQQEEVRKLALVAQHSSESVIISDAAGRIQWVNAAFTELTGFSAQEAIGRTPGALLNGPETSEADIAEISDAIAWGRPHKAQILNYTKSGKKTWVESNLFPLPGRDGQTDLIIGIERDVTEQRKMAQDLARAEAALSRAEAAQTTLIETLRSELSAPLRAIAGMTRHLRGAKGIPPEEQNRVLALDDAVSALTDLLENLSELARLEPNLFGHTASEFKLDALISDIAQAESTAAQGKGMFLDVAFADGADWRVCGDPKHFAAALRKVLTEAVSVLDTGGVSVRACLYPRALGAMVEVAVVASGRPAQEEPHEAAMPADDAGGAGLVSDADRDPDADPVMAHPNLRPAWLLARRMHGDLTLTRSQDQSYAYTLSARFDLGTHAAGFGRPAAGLQTNTGLLEGLHLLIAEDTGTNRVLLEKFLSPLNVRLSFARDGNAALEMALRDLPDIILMDVKMPVLNGIAATRAIRAKGSSGEVPQIVGLTAHGTDATRAACLSAGMNRFLTKPVRRADLVNALVESAVALDRADPAA